VPSANSTFPTPSGAGIACTNAPSPASSIDHIADIDVPFNAGHGPGITRDPRYLDLRDEIEDLLGSV